MAKVIAIPASIIAGVILVVGMVPFVELETKITIMVYLAIPLMTLAPSWGIAFVTKRIEAVILGFVFFILCTTVLLPILKDALRAIFE